MMSLHCKLGEECLALSLLLSASLYLCTFIIILIVHREVALREGTTLPKA